MSALGGKFLNTPSSGDQWEMRVSLLYPFSPVSDLRSPTLPVYIVCSRITSSADQPLPDRQYRVVGEDERFRVKQTWI